MSQSLLTRNTRDEALQGMALPKSSPVLDGREKAVVRDVANQMRAACVRAG